MTKPVLGMLVGGILGLLDGLSASASPEARPMMLAIVIGSTLKGVVTGLLAGFIARWRRSTLLGVVAGLLIGLALSSVVAIGQTGHYIEIVLPGMLVGAFAGFVTQRYPQGSGLRSSGRTTAVVLAVALFSALPAATSQTPRPTDPLAPISALVGRWVGTSEGQPGKGTVEREYERVLGARFIRARNRSTYPPQEKNPNGEVHEDEGWFSFDRARERIVFRQFHIEGFVNQYVEEGTAELSSLTFVSESIENIPQGFRARETYRMQGPDEFEEVFELSEPGKPFEVYSRTRLKRVR